MLEKEQFRSYTVDESKKADVFTIRLNKEERLSLEKAKKALNQKKDSTAMKQLADLGKIVLHDGLTHKIINTLFINKRRNKHIGINDFE